jgi:hypothetical protein
VDGSVFLVQWMEPGAHGDPGLSATRAWGSLIGARHAASPPLLREAGPVLEVMNRVALVRTIPHNVRVRVSLDLWPGGALTSLRRLDSD